MMTVLEYADDMNKKVEEIIGACKKLSIKINEEKDLLSDEDITILDNYFSSEIDEEYDIDNEIDEIVEDIKDTKKIDVDNSVSKQKLKKKNDTAKNKKDLAQKKKEMYKNKKKLMSNTPTNNSNIVLYKENMSIGDLAKELGVSAAEIVKKLFSQGLMVTINTPISYENAEILVLDYNK